MVTRVLCQIVGDPVMAYLLPIAVGDEIGGDSIDEV